MDCPRQTSDGDEYALIAALEMCIEIERQIKRFRVKAGQVMFNKGYDHDDFLYPSPVEDVERLR
jgi:hypothetical protein